MDLNPQFEYIRAERLVEEEFEQSSHEVLKSSCSMKLNLKLLKIRYYF